MYMEGGRDTGGREEGGREEKLREMEDQWSTRERAGMRKKSVCRIAVSSDSTNCTP